MKDFVELILPGVVSLVLGVMAAIVTPMLRRSATLRRQLEADAAIVQQLADPAAEELRLDMGHRSAHLVAHSRFPGWTRLDVGLLVVSWLVAGLFAAIGVRSLNDPRAYFDSIALAPVVIGTGTQVGVMYVVFIGWQVRAIGRVNYLEQHLPEQSFRDAKIAARMSAWLTKCVIVLPILAQSWIYVGFQFANGTVDNGFDRAVAIVFPLLLSSAVISASRTPELTRRLPRAADLGLSGMGMAPPEVVESRRQRAEERARRPRRRWWIKNGGDPIKNASEPIGAAPRPDTDDPTTSAEAP